MLFRAALRRKCDDRNASGPGGRGLLVLAVRPRGVFGALKQAIAFGAVDLMGDESATDAAAVQRHDRIRFNIVVPRRISGSTEVRRDEDDAPPIGEVHQRTSAGSTGLRPNVRQNDGGEGPNGGNSPPREPDQSRIESRGDVPAEATTQWRENHPTDDPMGH